MDLLRFGGSTFSFMWEGPAIRMMRAMQEFGLNDFDVLVSPGHMWPSELSATARTELRAAFKQEGLRVESLNVPALDFNLASCVQDIREYSTAFYCAVLRLSSELGGAGVVVVPGRVSALLPPKNEHTLSWLAESVGLLLGVAETENQIIYLETHPLSAIRTSSEVAEFLHHFDHPRLLVAYDTANAEFIGECQPAALARFGPKLGQVHLSDCTRTVWRHDRVGTGSVDFVGIVETLRDVRFSGTCVIEIISSTALNDIEASFSILRDVALNRSLRISDLPQE